MSAFPGPSLETMFNTWERCSVSGSAFLVNERQQRYLTRSLNGGRQIALLFRRQTSYAAWQYFPAIGNELPQQLHVFVVDRIFRFDW